MQMHNLKSIIAGLNLQIQATADMPLYLWIAINGKILELEYPLMVSISITKLGDSHLCFVL